MLHRRPLRLSLLCPCPETPSRCTLGRRRPVAFVDVSFSTRNKVFDPVGWGLPARQQGSKTTRRTGLGHRHYKPLPQVSPITPSVPLTPHAVGSSTLGRHKPPRQGRPRHPPVRTKCDTFPLSSSWQDHLAHSPLAWATSPLLIVMFRYYCGRGLC